MKRILIIGLILVSLLLTGCSLGIFNLTGYVMPDDSEFLTVVQGLDTPQKTADYMRENFTYKETASARNPYMFWKSKVGDCNDFCTLGVFVSNFHNYETYQIRIYYNVPVSHMIGVYMEDKISFTDVWIYSHGYNTFREVVDASMRYRVDKDWVWTKYEVYDYNMNVIERGVK